MLDQIIAADTFFFKLRNALSEIVGTEGNDNLTCEPSTVRVFLTEILNQKHILTLSPEFTRAKQTEIDGLMKRGTFRAVNMANVPKKANVLRGRFVCTLKNSGTDREHPKARFVAQGHKDQEKPFIVHNMSSLRQSSTKVIVSTAAVMNFRVFTHDVKQAYLQSKDRLTRKIYLKPKEGDRKLFSLKQHEILKLEKPLYGVCDAGDYWGDTVISHIEEDLGMVPLAGDPSLYMKESAGNVDGLLGTYVDDFLLAGNTSYQNLTTNAAGV